MSNITASFWDFSVYGWGIFKAFYNEGRMKAIHDPEETWALGSSFACLKKARKGLGPGVSFVMLGLSSCYF